MSVKKVASNNGADEIAKVSEQLDEEEIRQLDMSTPVSDEDGIIRNVPLLAGFIDENGVLQDTFSYREMTGKDEEAISKNDIRSNGAKLINTLVERCVVAIGTHTKKELGAVKWAKLIREMLGGDLDYMAFKIREVSKGREISFSHKCPNCGQKLVTIINTEEFPINTFKGEYKVEFTLERGYKDPKGAIHKTGTLRLPNGYDREMVTPLFKKNPSTAITALLSRLITFDDGAYVSQNNIGEMYLRDRDILENIIKENTFGIDTTIEGITCDNCGQDLSGEVGESNFF